MKTFELHDFRPSYSIIKRKLPNYITMIIMLVTIMLISLVIILDFMPKKFSIKKMGMVTNINQTQVNSLISGQIDKIVKKEGDYVSKGDLIIVLTSTLNKQLMEIKRIKEKNINLLKDYEKKIDILMDYRKLNIKENDLKEKLFELLIDEKSQVKDESLSKMSTVSIIDRYKDENNIKINQIKSEIKNNENQIEAIELSINQHNIYARSDGYLTFTNSLQDGSLIDVGIIGTICDDLTEETLLIRGYLSRDERKAIMKLEENLQEYEILINDDVKYLNFSFQNISKDSVNVNNQLVYKYVLIPNYTKNRKTRFLNGEYIQIEISYYKDTWLKWLLNKVGM